MDLTALLEKSIGRVHASWPTLRRAVRKKRRSLVLLVAASVILAVGANVAPHLAPGVRVFVPRHDIAAGARVSKADVELRTIRADLVPSGAIRESEFQAGLTAKASIPKGFPLSNDFLGEGHSRAKTGHALVSIPLRDPSLAIALHQGTKIRVVCPESVTSSSVTISATVFQRPESTEESAPTMPFAATGDATVMVEIENEQLSTIAQCTAESSPFIAVLG